MRGQMAIVAVSTAVLLVSCAGTTTPSSSPPAQTGTADTAAVTTVVETTATSVADITTSTLASSTTTTVTSPATFAPPNPFVAPSPAPTGGGSGCSPGSGPLPDGVWFGFIDGVTETTLDFYLACYLSCDPGEGFHVGNSSSNTRTLRASDAANVIFEAVDGPDWEETFERMVSFGEIGLHNDAWVYVNDGTVTHIVLPAELRGCRYDEIEVEWGAQLARTGQVDFNDIGLASAQIFGADGNLFRWKSDEWGVASNLDGEPYSGPEGFVASASGRTVAIGAHVHRWTGSAWSTDVFDALPGEPRALSTSGDRVLMTGIVGEEVLWYVLTWTGDSWSVDTVPVDARGSWTSWSGAISGDKFAIADPGNYGSDGPATVRIFTWDGATWTQTATLHDKWDTGNWGSSLDLNGDKLLVGADGATPGPGSLGGAYLYTRVGGTWTPEVVGEGGEGFGFGARIDGNTIVTAAAHSDEAATFWVFVQDSDGWRGTPISIDGQDPFNDWVTGVDIHGTGVAVSTNDALWIGMIRSSGE